MVCSLVQNCIRTRNQRKLVDAALNRLSRPVGGGEKSLVVDWEELPNKKLLIQVSGQWLQPPYVPVATPLPRTPTAMALYLFLHSIETNNTYSRTDSSMIGLCERLGIPTRFGNAVASQLLDRALKSVNEHIKRLDHDELEGLASKYPSMKSDHVAGESSLLQSLGNHHRHHLSEYDCPMRRKGWKPKGLGPHYENDIEKGWSTL